MTGKLVDVLVLVRKVPAEIHVLFVLCTAMGLLASPTGDSIRDLYQAYAIANGEHWPLQGPQLAGSLHLGPVWFYLLAIPALIGDNLHAVSVFVFALSGLKFYLAWLLGQHLHSSTLGLAFALMLALPGWSSTQLVIWTHTSVLEAAILAYLILLRRAFFQARNGAWFWLGVTYSLAVHAHPTAAPFAWLMIFALTTIRRRPIVVPWFLLGAVIPLFPYVLSQSLQGFPDLSGLGRYGRTEFDPGGLSELSRLIYSVVVIGPNLFYKTTLSEHIAPAFIMAHWTLVAAGLAGFLFSIQRVPMQLKKLAMIGLSTFFIVTVFVVLIRGRTPWHLAYASSLSLAFVYAVFWTAVLQYAPKARLLLAPAIIIFYTSVIGGAALLTEDSSLRFQEKVFYDVKNLRSEWGPPGLIIPARYAKAHGDFLCREPVALHGPYAASIDAQVGLQAAFTCDRTDSIMLGGKNPAYTHWVGVSKPIQTALGTDPQLTIGNVGLYTPMAIGNNSKPLHLGEGNRYPPRPFLQAEKRELESVTLQSETPSALIISKPIGVYLALEIREVLCNGTPARLLVDTNYAWVYACSVDIPGETSQWQARYIASAPEVVDSVLLPFTR